MTISTRGVREDWEIQKGATFLFYVETTSIDGSEPDYSSGWTAWAEVKDEAGGTSRLVFTIANSRVVMGDNATNRVKFIVSEDDTTALDDITGAEYDLFVKRTSDALAIQLHWGKVKTVAQIGVEP
jgi:hypothetical protein